MSWFPLKGNVTPLIFEKSRRGRRGTTVPRPDVPVKPLEQRLPREWLRTRPARLPEVPENEVVRHYTELSLKNHHIDRGFYPLGSCTMKYNPKVTEVAARLRGFAGLHPWTPDSAAQGALRLLWELGSYLREISGMDAITLQPAAGAHGELTGVLIIRAYHTSRGNPRKRVIIADTAHGTNPATVATVGYEVVTIPSNDEGRMDLGALRDALDEETAAVMLTNPNTLGKFESEIEAIAELVHGVGALLYMDGANLNALMGVTKPALLGYDLVHFNLHKTFSTPHGGGGPGAGPVAVRDFLEPFLPVPVVTRKRERYLLDWDCPQSIGKIHGFWGNFGVLVRAYTYIRLLGREDIRPTSETAVLNSAYMTARLEGEYPLPFGRGMHESIFSGSPFKKYGVRATDIAKRLLDFGVHAPTIYFPLLVPEAIMIEPTETETREEIDRFCDAMLTVAREAREDPERVKTAPHTTPIRRPDEAKASRELDLRWSFPDE